MTDKVAVVTGARRGLGKETAKALRAEGYLLATCARRTSPFYDQVTTRGASRFTWVHREVNVRDHRQVDDYVRFVEQKLGPVDVLVNNAGYVHARSPIKCWSTRQAYEYFDPCLETNFVGPLNFILKVLPGMLERDRGVIVNVASKAARYAVPGFAAYNASKAALVSLTQTLAKELEGTGIRVYSVSPGGMNTRMREAAYGKEDAAKQQSPEFVAKVIADLVEKGAVPHILTGGQPEYKVPSGADVLVWRGEVAVYPMEDRR